MLTDGIDAERRNGWCGTELRGASILIWLVSYPIAVTVLFLGACTFVGNYAGPLICVGIPYLGCAGLLLGAGYSLITRQNPGHVRLVDAACLGGLLGVALLLSNELTAALSHVSSLPVESSVHVIGYLSQIVGSLVVGVFTAWLEQSEPDKSAADLNANNIDGEQKEPILLNYARHHQGFFEAGRTIIVLLAINVLLAVVLFGLRTGLF